MGRVFAAADIGSNTVHLLIAETDGKGLQRLRNESEWLSLGQIVSECGHIPAESQSQLLATLRAFRDAASVAKAEGIYVFATEAMRIASNHEEILKSIRKSLGLKVDLISGKREAELGMSGALIDTSPPWPALLVEVGGGSAQVAFCSDSMILEESSLPIGTGRLISELALSSPNADNKVAEMEDHIHEQLKPLKDLPPVVSMIASGGVARGLWRAIHPDGERQIHRKEVEFLGWSANRSTLNQIVARFNVKSKRAATLAPGACIFYSLMERFQMDTMQVSEFGVREGAILEMSEGSLTSWRD